MAYKPILQAVLEVLEYKPCGFLPGTNGTDLVSKESKLVSGDLIPYLITFTSISSVSLPNIFCRFQRTGGISFQPNIGLKRYLPKSMTYEFTEPLLDVFIR